MPFDGSGLSQALDQAMQAHPPATAAPAKIQVRLAWMRTGLRSLLLADPAPLERHVLDSAVSLLQATRALVADERSWTAKVFRSADGRHCIVGALHRAARNGQGAYRRSARQTAHRFLLGVARERGFKSVEKMNDSSIHAEMLLAFDVAIAFAGRCQPAAE